MKTRHNPARPLAPRFDDDDEDGEEDGDEKKKSAAQPLLKRLLETRTILLTGPVSDDMAKEIMAQLLVLDAADCEKPIKVFVNSPGGSIDAGFAIFDTMRFVKSPVYTICTGLAASAALGGAAPLAR